MRTILFDLPSSYTPWLGLGWISTMYILENMEENKMGVVQKSPELNTCLFYLTVSPEIPLPNFCQPSKVCPKSPGCTEMYSAAQAVQDVLHSLSHYIYECFLGFSTVSNWQWRVTEQPRQPSISSVSSTLISSLLFTNLASTMASVAVGLGQINPGKQKRNSWSFLLYIILFCSGNPSECIDPDTGLSHPLGSSWGVAGCGQASCDLRQGTVFMSYS